MHTPVFFSVGKEKDTKFATQVHKEIGESLAYHYQITGQEVVNFRKEIESKITECNIFVAFWSRDYLSSEAACVELAFFRKLVESGMAPEKKLIIVPQDNLDIQTKWTNPITQKTDEFALGNWRNERSIGINADANRVARIILRKLEELKVIHNILIPRGWITDLFKGEISQPSYEARELIFVTGLEGHGRRTALSQYMNQTHPHRIARSLHLDSIEGPRDLLIRLMEVSSMTPSERDDVFNQISNSENENTSTIKEIRKILHQSRDNKSYYVISIDKFSGVDAVKIPLWLSEVMSVFGVGKSPLIFIVTSSPVTQSLLDHYPKAGRVKVPGLEESEMSELVHLLSLEDPIPNRWANEQKKLIAVASGSNPAMCKSIMRKIATEPNLDFVKEIAARVEIDFGQALAALMSHWTNYYQDKKSDLFALRVIEKLGVTSKDALDEMLASIVQKHGDFNLYTMRDQGLIEQLSDGIYRIPPLIQRLLGSALWGKVSSSEINQIFREFSKRSSFIKSDYGAIYASNTVAAAVRSGAIDLPPEYEKYLTIATLFKAGLEKYSSKQWAPAYGILQRAMTMMLKNLKAADANTMIEIARFSGLAAARKSNSTSVQKACDFLETNFSGSRRDKPAKAMAEFVRGFDQRIKKNFDIALKHFKNALALLEGTKNTERQRAAIYTEMATSYLRSSPPNFALALKMAKNAFLEKDVTHTLNAYVNSMILCTFRSGVYKSESDAATEISSIEGLLDQLKIRSEETMQSFYSDRNREFLREKRIWIEKIASQQPHEKEPPEIIDFDYA